MNSANSSMGTEPDTARNTRYGENQIPNEKVRSETYHLDYCRRGVTFILTAFMSLSERCLLSSLGAKRKSIQKGLAIQSASMANQHTQSSIVEVKSFFRYFLWKKEMSILVANTVARFKASKIYEAIKEIIANISKKLPFSIIKSPSGWNHSSALFSFLFKAIIRK